MTSRHGVARSSPHSHRSTGRHCLQVLLAWLVTASVACAGENLLQNPGFEGPMAGSLPEGWVKGAHYNKRAPDSSYAIDKTECHGGANSLRLTSETGDIPVIIQAPAKPVQPGQKYVFSAYLKSNKAGGALYCRMYLLSPSTMLVRDMFVKDQWQKFSAVTTVDAKQTNGTLLARLDLRDVGSIWIDDAMLAPVQDGEDLSPGDYLGYRQKSSPGSTNVEIIVGTSTGKDLSNINGVCYLYNRGKPLDPCFKEAGLKVVRNHNVLTSLHILSKDKDGNLQYKWDDLDASVDCILKTGAVPEMSLCFVPLELVDNPDPKKIRQPHNQFYCGPPSDMRKWEDYIRAVIGHCRATYDISGWYWIVGNEPEVPKFSMGTEDEYYALYRHTVDAALSVYPQIKIGAGSFATTDWLRRFIDRCGRDNTHVDLLSWHHYSMIPDEYGLSTHVVRTWMEAHPSLKGAGLAIDEWNPHEPDGVSTFSADEYGASQQAASIESMRDGGLLYHTFFIAYDSAGVLDPKGVKHPTFNVFRMFAMMGHHELSTTVPDNEPYVGAAAACDDQGVASVLVWNTKHKYDLHKGMAKDVAVKLGDKYKDAKVDAYLIDDMASNGYRGPQHQDLEKTAAFVANNGRVSFTMKPNSVVLIVATPEK